KSSTRSKVKWLRAASKPLPASTCRFSPSAVFNTARFQWIGSARNGWDRNPNIESGFLSYTIKCRDSVGEVEMARCAAPFAERRRSELPGPRALAGAFRPLERRRRHRSAMPLPLIFAPVVFLLLAAIQPAAITAQSVPAICVGDDACIACHQDKVNS